MILGQRMASSKAMNEKCHGGGPMPEKETVKRKKCRSQMGREPQDLRQNGPHMAGALTLGDLAPKCTNPLNITRF